MKRVNVATESYWYRYNLVRVQARAQARTSSMAGEAGTSTARMRWELENNVQNVASTDALYKYDQAEQQAIQTQKPWTKDPHFFKQ